MPQNLTYLLTLVQVMVWCPQATGHYLSQCWPRSLLSYGIMISRPQMIWSIFSKIKKDLLPYAITKATNDMINLRQNRHHIIPPWGWGFDDFCESWQNNTCRDNNTCRIFYSILVNSLCPCDCVLNNGGRSVRLSDIWDVFYELKICPTFLTVQCCYNLVHFLPNPPNRHPIAHLCRWAMGCLLWDQILLLSL